MPSGETDDPGIHAYCRSTRVVRDVVYFLHQQAEYSGHIDDDLDYTFFGEDYWQALLDDEDMDPDVQRGCLALLYAMGMYEAGNVGIATWGQAAGLPAGVATICRSQPRDAALQGDRRAGTHMCRDTSGSPRLGRG